MNISDLNNYTKAVSSKLAFQGQDGKVIALQILKDEQLKEHITKTAAFLICVKGEIIFENEQGFKTNLVQGDYVFIEPEVKHWLIAVINSDLILFK